MTQLNFQALAQSSFYDLSATDIDGRDISFSDYRGKILLIVNTASKCGFTSQYKGLEKLFEKYREKGFYVLGFPSNDFLSQEPGSDEEIKKFCQLKYDVSFPLFRKAPVTGEQKQPVYKFLTEQSAADYNGEIKWNFEKFLINQDGKVVDRWSSLTGPSSSSISNKIDEVVALRDGRSK